MSQLPDKEDVRIEYTAISSRLSQLASFRFGLAGLYLASIGVIISSDKPTKASFVLVIWLTLCLWIVELRTRSLLESLKHRMIYIASHYWGYGSDKGEQSYISQWGNEKSCKPKFLFGRISIPATHSLGFDMLFLGVIVYSVYQLSTI